MTRRNSQLPWTGRSSGGIYGGGSNRNYRQLVILGLIVLAVVVLGFFLVSKACGSTPCTARYCASSDDVAAPEGSEFVTKLYSYNTKIKPEPGKDLVVHLPLTKATTDARNLSFSRYVPETKAWETITAATLDGSSVSATLHDAPQLIAVLRRQTPGGSVVAYLPHNGTLHPDAAGHITMIHTIDFTPAPDGGVAGELSTIKPDASVQFLPQIQANNGIAGSVQIVKTLLSNAASRSAHVQNIAKLVADSNLGGVDISYQDLTVNERSSFTLFISELADRLHGQNKHLTVTLPPPLKLPDRMDEGAYDWGELAKSADLVQMMPYRDQGTYRKDMPDILQYLVGKVQPSTKLILTVSPYATEKAADGVTTMSITDAMGIATALTVRTGADQKLTTNTQVVIAATNINKIDGRTGVAWDENSATVAFTYEQNGGRTVYLENFFSIGFKLAYIPQYKLGGVAVEDASSNEFLGNIWTAIVPFITSGQPTLMQPNRDDLKPQWKLQKGAFDDSGKGSGTWTTPADPGTYTATLTLSDGVSHFQREIAANVQAKTSTTGTASTTPSG
jgi:spore germination protein YaaH